jgi:glutathione synthase
MTTNNNKTTPIKMGVVMDPIEDVKVAKDSSMAMMLEAQSRGYEIYYMEMKTCILHKAKHVLMLNKLKCLMTQIIGMSYQQVKISL